MKKNVFLTGFIALTMCGVTNMTAQVGINTDAPTTTLDIVQPDSTTNPGHGFRLRDGNEAAGKVLVSDPSGTASWGVLPSMAIINGNIPDQVFYNPTDYSGTYRFYTGCSITLPAGKWRIDVMTVLSAAGTALVGDGGGTTYGGYIFFSTSNTDYTQTPDYIVPIHSIILNVLNLALPTVMARGGLGSIFVNLSTTTTLYQWARMVMHFSSTSAALPDNTVLSLSSYNTYVSVDGPYTYLVASQILQ